MLSLRQSRANHSLLSQKESFEDLSQDSPFVLSRSHKQPAFWLMVVLIGCEERERSEYGSIINNSLSLMDQGVFTLRIY